MGYYHSDVQSDVKVDGRTVDVTYSVTLGDRYKIDKIDFSVPEGEFSRDFYADTANISVKPGDYLSEYALEQETERSAAWFRRNGWFGFTKNYYAFEADTLQKRDTADLLMMIREYTRNQSPENARPFRKYHFGDVNISWDGARDRDPHLRILVRKGMLLHQMVQECKSPCLAAEGSFSDPGEPEIVLVGFLVEFGYHTLAYHLVIFVYLLPKEAAELGCNRMMGLFEGIGKIEKAAGIQPLREHVPGCVADQDPVGDIPDYLLQLSKAGRATIFRTCGILE